MRAFLALFTIILGLSLAGCNEPIDDNPNIDLNPVFKLHGMIDENPLTLEAGNAEYYMFADFEYLDKNTLNKGHYIADLRPDSCTSCGPSVRIWIYSNSLGNSQTELIEEIRGQSLTYSDHNTTTERFITLQPVVSGLSEFKASWKVNGQVFSTSKNAVLKDWPDPSDVTLTITNMDGWSRSISNRLQLDRNMPKVDFTIQKLSEYNYRLISNQKQSTGANMAFWSYGNGNSIGQGDSVDLQFTGDGIYHIQMEVPTDMGSGSIVVNKSLGVGNLNHSDTFAVNYDYNFDSLVTSTIRETHLNVTIRYTSANGATYWSHLHEQSASSYFHILNAEAYRVNEQGMETFKIELESKCSLLDGDTKEPINMTLKGTVALGLPER